MAGGLKGGETGLLPGVSSRLDRLGPYSLLIVGQWKEAVLQSGLELCDLSLGDPQEPTPPFIRQKLVDSVSPSSSYPLALGLPSQRKAAAGWLQRRLGIEYPVDQVVPTSGSKEAIFHFVQLLEPGSRIGFPVPGYPVYEGAACLGGHEPVPIKLKPESGFALEMEDYNGPPLNALWVCSPHNPTGTVLDLPRMRSLLEWCQSQGVLLLSDECYIDSFDPGSLRPLSFLELTQKDNWAGVVSFFTLSKRSGMTGYRSGFVAGDRRYIDAFKKYRPHAGLASPAFVQEAAATAWADDAHVQQRASVYAAKRQVVISFLDDLGWERVKSDSTFYVWARLPKGYPVARSYLERLARTTGIVATPGDCFGASEEARDWFRIALVPPLDVLDGALERWRLFESKGD